MRVRQIIPSLKYEELVNRVIPDILPFIPKDILVMVKRFPQWVYKNKAMAAYGLLAETMLRYGLPTPALSDSQLALMKSKSMLEQIMYLLNSLQPGLCTEVDKSMQAGIGKMMQWIKKEPYLQYPYKGDIELKHEQVLGHPDLINANIVLDVKCCSKLEKHVPEFSLQILSYVALGRKMGYPLQYCGLVLPLQQTVLMFNVSQWNSEPFLNVLLSATTPTSATALSSGGLSSTSSATCCSKKKERKTLPEVDFEKELRNTILEGKDVKMELMQLSATVVIPVFLHKAVGHHIHLERLNEKLDSSVPYQVMIRNGRSGKCALEDKDQTVNWSHPRLTEWKTVCTTRQVFIHAVYIINICNPRTKISADETWVLNLVKNDLLIGRHCGFRGVVVHVGKTKNIDTKLVKMTETINKLLEYATPDCPLLLETPCGEGTETLTTIEEFIAFCAKYKDDPRLGIIVDTCHVFVAGYNPFEYLQKITTALPGKVKLIHYNDSQNECGAKSDGHMVKGYGFIGNTILDQIALLAVELKIPMVIE